MHVLVRESASLDQTEAVAEDLGLAAAELLVLSFSDSDLTTAYNAWRRQEQDREGQGSEVSRAAPLDPLWDRIGRPYNGVQGSSRGDARIVRPMAITSLRLANLARLRHPMSVDLLVEKTLPGTKAVLVRLLGGLDYWRYGCEELHRYCREHGVALAIVAGDGRPDGRLAEFATVSGADLAGISALLDSGGAVNVAAAMSGLVARAAGSVAPFAEPQAIAEFGYYRPCSAIGVVQPVCRAVVAFYRAFVHAGDTAPIDALLDALSARGVAASALYVPSLKVSSAAAWLRETIRDFAPDVILNATAFSAREGETGSPLDVANCPVLQVITAVAFEEGWAASARGLGAADLAMHVAMPELDGRIDAGVISFKRAVVGDKASGFAPVMHAAHADGIAHAADLALGWGRLRRKRAGERRVALMLSTYPGRVDQIAHAVGLDGPQSAAVILNRLAGEGYDVRPVPETGRDVLDIVGLSGEVRWTLGDYRRAFERLPEAFRDGVTAAWGAPEDDPTCRDGVLQLPVHRLGNVLLVLQPERGVVGDRKASYHDPATPPCHGFIACYLWLREVAGIDVLIHLGAHGTLEWLPGKAAALSGACGPRVLMGAVPVIYPFIVNDPGEAAQAKRRIGAVTLGHNTPPLRESGLDGQLGELEQLVDEFSSADGLDPKRRAHLVAAISDAAERAGIAQVCGLTGDLTAEARLARIDAFLCDVKEMTIRDGLHVLDGGECDAIVQALDGRFIEPGPSGAPSRGRADVLPTGRNLYAIDPRSIPTPTAMTNGARAAAAIQQRFGEDHGEWPRSIVLDLWGSATLRTGGEELATAMALLGVKPTWDSRSFRVSGYEIIPGPMLERPRVDVTLRISGLFRDMFPSQLAMFQAAVQQVAGLAEDGEFNPLAGLGLRDGRPIERIFGAGAGSYGTGVMGRIDASDWGDRAELGETYLANSAYGANGEAVAGEGFAARVRGADAFVHIQDHRETDLLTGGNYAAHEGGFAAAAKALGNDGVALYHGDTGVPSAPKIRTLEEECARVIAGRAANSRWIAGQMRHGFRGAAEIAATLDAAFAFAATAGTVTTAAFDALYEAYLLDESVLAFLAQENPAALAAMRARFEEARARGLWSPRRNDLSALDNGGQLTSAKYVGPGVRRDDDLGERDFLPGSKIVGVGAGL